MREILFRAKRSGKDEWVQGYLTKMWGMLHIIDENDENKAFVIDDETIGQFTGLTDKNGAKIFEGDIVQTLDDDIAVIQYDEEDAMYYLNNDNVLENFGIVSPKWLEIIGNIHDNPELLTGGTKWKDD